MWGQIGSAIGNFIVQSKMAQSKKEWQEYNNAMLRLQDAQNQNALTSNAAMAIEAGVTNKVHLQRALAKSKGKAEANAAAAGAGGVSVESVLKGLTRNALHQELSTTVNTERELASIEYKRYQSAMGAELQIDRSDYSVNPAGLVTGLFGAFASGGYNSGPQSGGTQGLML